MTSENKSFWNPVRISLFVLFGALTLYVLSLAYYAVISSNAYYIGTVTVTGHGEIEVAPDIRRMSVDIVLPAVNKKQQSVNSTSTTASNDDSNLVKKVTDLLKSKGIKPADIKTETSSYLIVKLRGKNMENADDIVSAVQALSRRQIFVNLGDGELESKQVAKANALDLALVDAKMNADKVGQALDADLGKITSYTDNSYDPYGTGYNSGYSADANYSNAPADSYGTGDNNDSLYPSTGMNPGSGNSPIKVTADVSVSYQVR